MESLKLQALIFLTSSLLLVSVATKKRLAIRKGSTNGIELSGLKLDKDKKRVM